MKKVLQQPLNMSYDMESSDRFSPLKNRCKSRVSPPRLAPLDSRDEPYDASPVRGKNQLNHYQTEESSPAHDMVATY